MADPHLAHYVAGWPKPGDVGLVASNERPAGAVWWRYFLAAQPGYGFVDESIPELALAVVESERGKGVGTLLMDAIIEEARHRRVGGLSLSVDADNRARRLYLRLGFNDVGSADNSLTMLLRI